ncbi:MAG: class I SAM-dependent methyltransferase [Cyclobacteriaceae bacterium]
MVSKIYNLKTSSGLSAKVSKYWQEHIHDLKVATFDVGSFSFYKELATYRYKKLSYLKSLIDSLDLDKKELLEVGCGVGIDLMRLTQGGANSTGIDISEKSVELAKTYFEINKFESNLLVMDAELIDFPDHSFDLVYCHSTLQFTNDPKKVVDEIYRVLKPGGELVAIVYNRISWLNALSILFNVELENCKAPVFRLFSINEFSNLLQCFDKVMVTTDRFPVKSALHKGSFNGQLYNLVAIPLLTLIPRFFTKNYGWHLIARASKRL